MCKNDLNLFRNWIYFWVIVLTLIFCVTFQPLIKTSHACRDLLDEAKKYLLRPDLRTHLQTSRTKPRTGMYISIKYPILFLTMIFKVKLMVN